MKTSHFNYPERLEPIRGIILFFVVLTVANIFWKYDVMGDEAPTINSVVTFWGLNISAPFGWMGHNVAHVTARILHFFGSKVALTPENILRYPNGHSVQIIWACTGLKQAYICFCILAFSRGPWLKKLWYIPLSLLAVYLFNIFRITFIVASIENHPNWFEFIHLYAFKYIFYGFIFLIWVYWEEKFVPNKQTKVSEQE